MNFRPFAAVSLSLIAAFVLSACGGAQPSNLPTATPASSAPTPAAAAGATSATSPTLVPTTAAAGPAAPTAAAPAAAAAATGDRPFAKYTKEQRSAVQKDPPPVTIDTTKKYIATIKTDKGDIVVELNPQVAPNTVNNFIYLAQNGFYDGLTFHRVEPGFVIQGGDPAGDGTGGPGYTIKPEIKLQHVDGAIAMARQGGDPTSTPSSGSQFYITMGAQPALDNNYTVFGVTVKGQDVVKKIAIGDKINSVSVVAADGGAVKVAGIGAPAPTAVPKAATCSPYMLNTAADDHVFGKASAPVTIIEYGDLQCPSCASFHAMITPTLAAVSDTVKLVFRHFPLVTVHNKADIAARGAEAAALQGKFWEMHDLLYEKQKDWDGKQPAEMTATLKTYAGQLGLDANKFEQDMASKAVIDRVQRDVSAANALKLSGTPSLFLDGRQAPAEAFASPDVVTQIKSYAQSRAAQLAGASAKTFAFTMPEAVTNKNAKYVMTVKTSKGDIVTELDPTLAPVNVNSTVFLAQQNYFNGAQIVVNDSQLGAVLVGSSTPSGNPGYECDVEKPAAGAMTKPGVVALFTNGDKSMPQFVFTYSPTKELDGRFTVIGSITSGLDVLKTLTATITTSGTVTSKGDTITGVTVAEKK